MFREQIIRKLHGNTPTKILCTHCRSVVYPKPTKSDIIVLFGDFQKHQHRSLALLNAARLYALVDVRSDKSVFEKFVTDIITGGVDIIQLRDKQADDRTLLARSRILKNCIAASRQDVLFIMNDRPELALLADADGVHVGQEELPVRKVRQMVGSLLIGVSTHSIEQARQAVLDGADYIGAGPVFESETKEFSELAGLTFLREVAATMAIPAFAIGGITTERLPEVLQTGIRRVAVSSALLKAENPREAAEKWKESLQF